MNIMRRGILAGIFALPTMVGFFRLSADEDDPASYMWTDEALELLFSSIQSIKPTWRK